MGNFLQALKDKARIDNDSSNNDYYEFEIMQDDYDTQIAALLKKNRWWQRLDIIAIVILIIALLYSVTTIILISKFMTKKYEVNLVQDTLKINENELETKTTQEILKESEEYGYVSNCKEFYYDKETDGIQRISKNNSTYYSISDMQQQLETTKLRYRIQEIKEVSEPQDSKTIVANQEFVYGFGPEDGSAQEARKGSNDLFFAGYSPELVNKYMKTIKPYTVERNPVCIVINERVDVTDDFVEKMLDGVLTDTYMSNRTTLSNDIMPTNDIRYTQEEKDDYFFGLQDKNNRMIYTCSHKIGDTLKGEQYIREYDILGAIETNIESYLGKDITLTTKIPKITNKPVTVIYLATETYCFDSWYVLGNQYQI